MSDGIDILLDGRRKLLPCQIERILLIREDYEYSYGYIAKHFFGNRISRQTIYLECSPKAKERAREKTKAIKKDGRYYSKSKNTPSESKKPRKEARNRIFV